MGRVGREEGGKGKKGNEGEEGVGGGREGGGRKGEGGGDSLLHLMMAEGVEKIKQPGDGKEQELDYQNIPKMATAQRAMVDEQTAGREAVSKKTQGQVTTQQPRADSRPIVDAWVKMSIKVKCLSEDKCIDVPLEMEETEEIPLYIQFLVICKKDFLHTLAKRAGVTLRIASNEIMFLVKGPCDDDSIKSLVEKLKIELKSAMSEITHQTIVIREKHQQKFLMTLEENLPEEFANHEAVLLKRTDQKEGYVLIGESQTFDECSKSINELINFVKRDSVVPKKIKVPLVPAQVEFFERLNMSQKLQMKFGKNIKIMCDGTSAVYFESETEGLARKCGIELSLMLKRIKTSTFVLTDRFSKVLSSPKIQENIYNQMKSAGIECTIRVSTFPSCIYLYVLDDYMSRKGLELIMNSIISTALEKRRLEENKKAIDEVLERFKDEVFFFDDDNCRTFLGVREAIENIDKIIRNSELETGHSAAEENVLQKGAVQGGEFREGSVTQTEEDVTPSSKFAAGSTKLECRKLPSNEKNPQKDGDQIQRKEVEYIKSENESTSHSVRNDGMQHDLARDPGNSLEMPISKEYQDEKMEDAKGREKDNETEDSKREKLRMESGHTNDRSDQPRKEKDYTVRDRREETSGQDEGNGLSGKENVISDGASKPSTSKTEEITKRNEKSIENTEDVCAGLQTTDTKTEKEINQQGRADNGTKAGSYPEKMQLEHKSKSVHLLTSTLDHPLGNDGRTLSKSYDERSGPSSNSQTQTILHQNETSSYEDIKKGKSNIGDEFARTSGGDKWDVTELSRQTETHPDEDFREEEAGIENLKKGDLTITVKGDQRTKTSGSYASSSGNGIGNNTRIGQSYIGSEAAEQQKMKEEEDEENDVFEINEKADIDHSSSNAGNADCVANRTRSKLGQKPGAQVRKQSKGEQQETKLTMEKHVVEFLRKNNANELETISEMENVAIDFCNDIIIIKGEKDCVKRAHEKIKEIKSKIHSEECSIDIPANFFTMRDTAIVKQKVADVMSKNMEVEFDGLDDKEPEYYFSWSSDRSPVCLILTYGKVENTKADAIVLPCNGDFSPFGQRADNIVKKGGKQMLHESMSELKRNKKKLSDFQIHSSELTGSLDCLALIFARIPILESIENTDAAEIGNMSLNLVKLMNAEKFRRLVIPVDIDDFCFTSFGSHLAYSLWETGRKELRHRIEIHLCFTRAGKINVSIQCDELVNVDKKVAVIVNSTNVHLNLYEGRVSKSLLNAAGSQIQAECKGPGQGPVHVGDVIPTSAGKMSCKEIYHGVLLPDWIPTGNFSLQVMKAMMRKCLCLADKKGNTSLAFPALGTGKLQYPWNKVAETMFEVIDDYSASVPNTCITDVLFVLHPVDGEAIEAFKFKEESRRKRSKAYFQGCMDTITYLETRIPEHGYRIQVLSETGRQIIPEKPEVEVRFEKQTDYPQQEIPKFDQDPSRNLYVVSMKVGSKKDAKKNSLQDAVKLTNEKRFVTAAFYINHFSEDKPIAERVENLKKTILKTLHPTERRNSQSSAASPVGKVFLRKFMFILSDAQFEKLEAKHSKKGFISRIKWKHAKDWNVIERTFGQSLELRITSLEKSLVNDMIPQVVHMIEQLKVVLMEWKGSWFLQVTGRGNKKNKLSVFTAQRLEWASMLKWKTIELENSNGVLWMYDLVKRKVYNQSGQQQSLVGNLIDERDDDQAPAKRVPKEAPKRPPTLPGKAVRQGNKSSA
ncbi:hypothetical protein FSP39_023067 [Pinctada imbricata]|uniref:Macro domain-containing protein n=1 Tax=Pinctada imbricata TaxID=66713 RepID=A0AA88YHS6_PINIB|nr:hypothetical protein FSP39_023067 [Pinctada imbricata]